MCHYKYFFFFHWSIVNISIFLSSCERPWCWTNTCRWRLCPGRGQEWSKASCVGCLDGATTAWVEARPPSPWGQSQCPSCRLPGVTAASPLTGTSQQTWSVPATGLEEKMRARYTTRNTITPSLTTSARYFKQLWALGVALSYPTWSTVTNKAIKPIFERVDSQRVYIKWHIVILFSPAHIKAKQYHNFGTLIPQTVWRLSSRCQCWFRYKLFIKQTWQRVHPQELY